MNLIVAVDRAHGIGFKGKLLYDIPEDLKYFKEKTLNKVVVMGLNTYLSLPFRPLKDRVNIVLSLDGKPVEGAIAVDSLAALFKELEAFNTDDVFVIGGQTIYNLLAEYCTTAYVTEIDAEAEADTYFHKVYGEDWQKTWQSEPQFSGSLCYKFCIFKNHNVILFDK